MKQRILKALNRARVWVNRLLWARSAMAAYNRPPEPGSPAAKFRENEEIPFRGLVWRVAKRVGGPEPAILLQPVGPTRARVKLAGAVGKRLRKQQEAETAKARAGIRDHQIVDRLGGSKA